MRSTPLPCNSHVRSVWPRSLFSSLLRVASASTQSTASIWFCQCFNAASLSPKPPLGAPARQTRSFPASCARRTSKSTHKRRSAKASSSRTKSTSEAPPTSLCTVPMGSSGGVSKSVEKRSIEYLRSKSPAASFSRAAVRSAKLPSQACATCTSAGPTTSPPVTKLVSPSNRPTRGPSMPVSFALRFKACATLLVVCGPSASAPASASPAPAATSMVPTFDRAAVAAPAAAAAVPPGAALRAAAATGSAGGADRSS
mmetsp:Transcript_52355/g.148231  ORF Transcript_52355/g.148231 Transcript_52355/m.148231 type:complete len:256 (-) Transcript_52355:35-802(-)